MMLLVVLLLHLLRLNLGEYIPPGPAFRCPQNQFAFYPCECSSGGDRGLEIECENTNLASLSVGLINVGNLDGLVEKLVISRCHVGRLYGSLLHRVKLRMLFIEDTPIQVLENHTFIGVNQTLNFLNFTRTNLNAFPTSALSLLGNVSTIIIDTHKIQSLSSTSFAGQMVNTLERLRITNGEIAAIPLDVFTPLRKLKILDLHGNSINELKKSQFKGLRDLEVLDLSHNSIKKLDSSHLADLTKLGWCNVSHNDLTDITRGTFARNTVLKVLHLSHNKIKKLDANTFRGMRFIRRLFLNDNEISNVGRGTFSAVSRIGTIDLARNKIKKIDYQMFFQLNYVELLDVSENLVTEIEKLAFKDLYLVTINVSHNAIQKVEPGAFENCANITLLDMSSNNISALPLKAFDDTTYATHLYLPFNNITSLSQVPLANMTGLKILNVSHNALTIVPKNSFPKLYELHTIDLSHNKLKSIYNGVFQVLFSLRELDLSFNSLRTISSSMFGALPTLLNMNLRFNNLSDISGSAFTRLSSIRNLYLEHNRLQKLFQIPPSLSHLDLSYNNLQSISQKWPTMNSLLSLDCSHNQLGDTLEKGSFGGLLTLQHLKLSYNNITAAPWNALSDLSSVQFLNFEGNSIQNLSQNAFGRLPIVFELNLAKNEIKDVSVRAFDGLLQLLTLNLSQNSISNIPNGAFAGLVSLRTLDLSFNNLDKIGNKTNGLLDDCLSLERVNLSHNRISFITRKTFPSDPYIPYKLKEIDLSYNAMPVITHELTIGTKKVEYLNLSANSITEIRKGVIGNLTNLVSLDLSRNQLSALKGIFEKPPQNLSRVYLSHNRFSELPQQDFANINLTVLDVRNNNLRSIPNFLQRLIENNTELIFHGNPLNCDCFIRPVRRWLSKQLHHLHYWDSLTCTKQESVHMTRIVQLSDNDLNCQDLRQDVKEPFAAATDVKFRELNFQPNGMIGINWLVTSNEDIADFYLILQKHEEGNEPAISIFEKLLAYSERKYVLSVKDVQEFVQRSKMHRNWNKGAYKLCLIAVDSLGTPRDFNDNQCLTIPSNKVANLLASSSASALFNPLLTTTCAVFIFYLCNI